MRKVAVLFGGESCEREISILTGVFTYNLIDRQLFEPVPVYFHLDVMTIPPLSHVVKYAKKAHRK